MTSSGGSGSGIALRVDRYPFDTVDVGVVGVGMGVRDVTSTGSAFAPMCGVGEQREWSDRLGALSRPTQPGRPYVRRSGATDWTGLTQPKHF